LRKKIFKF